MRALAPDWPRRALVCASLVNLLYLRVWSYTQNPGNRLYFEDRPHWSFFVSPAAAVLLGALLLFALHEAARRAGLDSRLAKGVFLALVLVVLNGVRNEFPALAAPQLVARLGPAPALALGGAVGGAALWLLARRPGLAVDLATRLVLVMSPFLLVTFGRAAQLTFAAATAPPVRLAGPLAGPREGPRVVFVIFDALDQGSLFAARPAGLALPEFDRLRREAVAFDKASAAGNNTLESVPSLTTGAAVELVRELDADLLLRVEGKDDPVRWSGERHLFAAARALGADTFVSGWYVPYCRIFQAHLTGCLSWPYLPAPDSFAASMTRDLEVARYTVPGLYRLLQRPGFVHDWGPDGARAKQWHIQAYQAIHEAALDAVRDPRLDLVYLHYPIPHGPGIFDEQRREFASGAVGSFRGNLLLADATLGELRSALEQASLWEKSAMIVLSDHPPARGWQPPEVPFLLKLPGATAHRLVGERVATVRVFDVLLALLEGRPLDPERALALLRADAPGAPPPPAAR